MVVDIGAALIPSMQCIDNVALHARLFPSCAPQDAEEQEAEAERQRVVAGTALRAQQQRMQQEYEQQKTVWFCVHAWSFFEQPGVRQNDACNPYNIAVRVVLLACVL